MNEFDKALEDITFEGEWIGDSYQEDLLGNYPEVIEQIKQAIAKHIIGEDEPTEKKDSFSGDDQSWIPTFRNH